MEARAVNKHVRTAPRKLRTVVNVVRGKSVPEALGALNFLPHRATRVVESTIRSAVHNLMDQHPDERFDDDELVVREIRVDEGTSFKRFRPAARGRAAPYKKRTSHLTVVVAAPLYEDMDA
ncbi:MAG: 50S ribosomal protein L22 [Candidatus Wenzhouxiangella sp. M2_3B_020]